LEWLLPASAALCLLISTLILSPKQPMGLDEVLTFYGVAHNSFRAFLGSYVTGVNATPPLYFLATWAASLAIPPSALSLRIYSSLASGAAVFIIWIILRRHAGFFASSAATLTACLTANLFLSHNSEARFYGLYFALIAWETYNYDRIYASDSPSSGRLFRNSISHGLAVSCHYVAGFYSLAVLASLLIADRSLRVWRPKVYLSVVAGCLPLLLYARFIWLQRYATAWLGPPGPGAAFNPVDLGLHAYFVLCALAGLVAVALLRRKHWSSSLSGAASGNRAENNMPLHLVILAFAFLAVPYGLLLVSWAGLPLLLDRYELPSLIGVALLFGFVCSGLSRDWFEKFPRGATTSERAAGISENILRAVLLAGILLYPLTEAIQTPRIGGPPQHAFRTPPATQRTEGAGPGSENGMVLATTDWATYFPLYFQSGESRRIYWVVADVRERKKIVRFNSRLNPIAVDDFLATHERFQIISKNAKKEWLEGELRRRGGFLVTIEDHSGNSKLLTVLARK
jgi:hypothetical protein